MDTEEFYLQGLSSSLPEDVQINFLKTISGLENVEVMRSAYAIEYDALDPTQLRLSLETRAVAGLFTAGQINGTSGYEEAAAQGLVAGVNAVQYLNGKPPMILDRTDAYIGVLIDDIVTKGTREPYRIMTSRVEYRLLLRQDNADERLTPIGYKYGLINRDRYDRVMEKMDAVALEKERLKKTGVPASDKVNELLATSGSSPLVSGTTLFELIKRPEISYEATGSIDPQRPRMAQNVSEQVGIQVKYENYILKQKRQTEQFLRAESRVIPEDFDYDLVRNLRLEARIKLKAQRPENLGRAGRISGVSPADVIAVMLELQKSDRHKGASDVG
jgi:tRNA uridine 5-carboxymethylaminomethyl modification enzyme